MVAVLASMLLIVALIALAILAAVQKTKKERERTQALQQTADALGWSFEPVAEVDSIPGIDRFTLYDPGHSREVRNLMYREVDEVNTTVFDFIYSMGTDKHRTTHVQSVVHLEPIDQSFPDFSLWPEGPFDKLFSAFGYQDIDFGQRPDFSRKYILRGKDEPAIRQTFNDRLLSFYESEPGLFTDAVDNQLFVYRAQQRLEPGEIESFVDLGKQILTLMRRD